MENTLIATFNKSDGGLNSLIIADDDNKLNFIEGNKTHGTPYGHYEVKSVAISDGECVSSYQYKGLTVVANKRVATDYVECEYIFKNNTDTAIQFSDTDLGIYAPFNDNYESSAVCKRSKCHAHIWLGGNTAYIAAKRMSGEGNNLALVLTKGYVTDYAVERAWNSNDRGDFILLLPAMALKPREEYTLAYRLIKYNDFEDLFASFARYDNMLCVEADKYTAEINEKIIVKVRTDKEITASSGVIVKTDEGYNIQLAFRESGEHRLTINYGDYSTFAEFYVIKNKLDELDKRLNFIIDNQMITSGRLAGAIPLYDNETGERYIENKPINDHNYARERMGMTASLMGRVLYGDISEENREKFYNAAKLNLNFFDKMIVKDNGEVYEKPKYKRMLFMDRLYNYSWAMLIFTMGYQLFGEARYLKKAAEIARRYYKKGGDKFYAINLPFSRLVKCADESGNTALAKEMRDLFLRHGDRMIEISTDYPAHEVKYEQSIVAPAIDSLLECYILSHDEKYLKEAEKQLKLLEAFNGKQPSFHTNEVSIRHWDGYWFGKYRMYGDTFPHYWSCITAAVFSKYARIKKNSAYQDKANICLDNNLCLIKDGRGSCAYVMPKEINKKRGGFYDPWANDQDWLIWFNLNYNTGLKPGENQ